MEEEPKQSVHSTLLLPVEEAEEEGSRMETWHEPFLEEAEEEEVLEVEEEASSPGQDPGQEGLRATYSWERVVDGDDDAAGDDEWVLLRGKQQLEEHLKRVDEVGPLESTGFALPEVVRQLIHVSLLSHPS